MRIAVLALLLSVSCPPFAGAEKIQDLKPQGYVDDFAGVLDGATRAQITALCAEIDKKAGAEIAVVTIRTLDGVPIEDFASRLYEHWGVGPKSNNRGVLILLATADRRYRVEVGYGLEPILPDGKVGGFGREMVPRLRQSDYNGALLHLTASIAEVIARERGVRLDNQFSRERRPLSQRDRSESTPALTALMVLILLLFAGFGTLGSMFRRPRRRFGIPWWLMGGGPWGGSWGMGGGFGGSGGGGGFGGFGGGLSGGGGASGSW